MRISDWSSDVCSSDLFNSEEILACDKAGVTVTLPKPMTSGSKAKGHFVKADFRYLADEDVYSCPAGERLKYYFTNEEKGLTLRRYWTNACRVCAIKHRCTTGVQRRDRKSTRLNSSHYCASRMPTSACKKTKHQ